LAGTVVNRCGGVIIFGTFIGAAPVILRLNSTVQKNSKEKEDESL